MADNETKSSAPAPDAATMPTLQIVSQYVKDMSFENPGVGQQLARPKIELGVDVSANTAGEDLYEAVLKIRVTASQDDKPIFLLELTYAGLFQLRNIPRENLEPVLLIECPRILFPFARRIVADAIRDGGLPPVMLDPIDFGYMYQQRRQGAAQQTMRPTATV